MMHGPAPLVSDDDEQNLVDHQDPRHQDRVTIMQQIFAWSFGTTPTVPEAQALIDDLSAIDQQISLAAPERPLDSINKVDLAVLRVIVFESKRKKTPAKVLVNEGVELAKEFGSESSPRFVNGVLATVLDMPASETTV